MSLRDARLVPWNGGLVQAEDVLVRHLPAQLHLVDPVPPGRLSRLTRPPRVARALSAAGWRTLHTAPPAPATVDVAFAAVNDFWEAAMLLSARSPLDTADVVVMHISEVSARDIRRYPDMVHMLPRRVDHLFTGTEGVDLSRLRTRRLRTVEVVPPLLDVLGFPDRPAAERTIDVLNVGRRAARQHELLVAWADDHGADYRFDTSRVTVTSVLDHRIAYAEMLTSAKVFVANTARFDDPVHRTAVGEVGARFYEGLAAGCVLAGDFPTRSRAFPERIAAADPVPFPLAAAELPAPLASLLSDPEALDKGVRRARAHALRHHDIAHRWVEMSRAAGLPIPSGITERVGELGRRATALVGPPASAERGPGRHLSTGGSVGPTI